jgi:hypothetical protein
LISLRRADRRPKLRVGLWVRGTCHGHTRLTGHDPGREISGPWLLYPARANGLRRTYIRTATCFQVTPSLNQQLNRFSTTCTHTNLSPQIHSHHSTWVPFQPSNGRRSSRRPVVPSTTRRFPSRSQLLTRFSSTSSSLVCATLTCTPSTATGLW